MKLPMIGIGLNTLLESWYVVARTIFGEARNQPYLGQVAVAWVIRNRVLQPKWWGDSFYSVCTKAFQFSCWNNDDGNAANKAAMLGASANDPHFLQALGIAALVITGDIKDPTNGATHYHAPMKDKPSWAYSYQQVAVIDDHTFYKERV